MQIIINTNDGTVRILSNDAILLRDANVNEQSAKSIAAALDFALGEIGTCTETVSGEVGVQEQLAPAPTAVVSEPVINNNTVMTALKTLLEESPQYSTRSAAAIAKKMGTTVEAIQSTLDSLVFNDDLESRARRSGEVVYSVA